MNVFTGKVIIFYATVFFCIELSCDANLIREKRVDETAEINLRTKRVENERDKKVIFRTKRIDIGPEKTTNTGIGDKRATGIANTTNVLIKKGLDRIRKIWEGAIGKNHRPKSSSKKEKKSLKSSNKNSGNLNKVIAISEDNTPVLAKKTPDLTNEISQFPLIGKCSAHKINKTYVAPNCQPVQVESAVCMGSCDSHTQILSQQLNSFQTIESCTFCGPVKYVKKRVYFHCNTGTGKRRRWKLEARKILTAESCGCLEDFCYNLNRVSNEGMNRFS